MKRMHGAGRPGMAMLAVVFAALAVLAARPARAQDLPTDPTLVTGKLDNGLAYIVKQHPNPPGRVSMYLHIGTGSLNETDHQRGIAHYLEHMAFNGSEHFPPGSVVPFFESLGLTFGQHQNAFTSFDQTTYILDLPDTGPETLSKGLQFFGDVATRLLLEPKEIEDERQVILEEKRSGLGAQQRVQDIILSKLAPGSLLGERLPIGTEETIRALSPDDFRAYYSKWYTPSDMTLMMVGDLPKETMVEHIKSALGGGPAAAPPRDQDMGVRPSEGMRAIIAADPELRDAEVAVAKIGPAVPPARTESQLRAELVEMLGQMAHNRRLQAKVAAGSVRFLGGYAFSTDLFRAMRLTQASASGEPSKWKDMLEDSATELQRSRLHGFSDRELDDVERTLMASAEQAVKTESTRPARAILGQLNSDVAEGAPTLSAAQRLALLQKLLPSVTVKEVSERFASMYDMSSAVFILKLPSGAGQPAAPSEAELIAAGTAALNTAPASESEGERPETLMTARPEAGAVAESEKHEATGVTSVWLSNGVRVHHRFMDIRKDQVSVTISLAGGTIRETAETHGLTAAAALALDRPATSTLSSTNIRDLMTDKKVSVSGGADVDTFTIGVTGSPEDLETGMQLAYLLLTDPVIEAAALEQWKTEQLQSIEARKLEPGGVLGETIAALLYPAGEVRMRPLEADEVARITLAAAQQWLTGIVRTAPIEVSIIGDLPLERAIELARVYLGSLPARERISGSTWADLRKIDRPAGPLSSHPTVKTLTPQAIVVSGFFGADQRELKDTRLLQMASRILSTRMLKQLREQEQLVYSIGVQSQPGAEFPGYGVVIAGAPTEPAKARTLERRITEMYAEFAKDGPTEEEMGVARTQVANTFAEQMPQPGFWIGKLTDLTYRSAWTLDDLVAAPAAYQAFTAEEVRDAFARYFRAGTSFVVVVTPETGGAAAPGGPASPKEGGTGGG
ncbi:MAG: insulinase family protein [Phycisphaerales bacterium]|nr:insulinase family protein [Phycisphaerales bacterium]